MTGAWLDPAELRVGLGCMRLSTDEGADDGRALATIAAAVEAGVTVFDTARAYGGNERLLARALRECGSADRARIVTKGGMARPGGVWPGGAWVADGRAKAIRADCEASLAELDGLPIDIYLLHAPDPRTPWKTSVRALARLADEGLVRRVGLANVNRDQLDQALALVEVAAVQVALGPFDDRALRGGVVERCSEAGVALIAHSPLGGPRRAGGLVRRTEPAAIAAAHGATAAEVALAWVLGLSPGVVAIPGARRPETARSAARAAALELDERERAALSAAFGSERPVTGRARGSSEVVVVMGIPGAGKTRLAAGYAGSGYERLNRDERGGTLKDLAAALDRALASGAARLVLDNTYLTRAARSHVLDAAARHGAAARCVWLETPLAQAQINLVERLLDRFGALPSPEQLRDAARDEPGLLAPTSQMRAVRELEPPATDEGWSAIERVAFVREPPAGRGGGVFVAAPVLGQPEWQTAVAAAEPGAPHLLFDWRPGEATDALAGDAARLKAQVAGPVEAAVCPHEGGPPRCWCRPPLPGLPLAFARLHAIDPGRSLLLGTGPAHRTLANALGARYVPV